MGRSSPNPAVDLPDPSSQQASAPASHQRLPQSHEGRRGATEESDVIFVKENVSVHPTQNTSERINGRLRVLKQGPSLFMTWIPYTQRSTVKTTTVVNGSNGPTNSKMSERDRNLYTIRAVPLAEIRSIQRHTPPLGWQYIIVVLTSGLAFPPLYFHNGGVKQFLARLKEYVHIVRSVDNASLYLINNFDEDPLQRSLSSLELREVVSITSVAVPEKCVSVAECQDQKRLDIREDPSSGNSECFQGKAQAHAYDISNQVLEKFSLVTRFARGTTSQLFGERWIPGNADDEGDFGPVSRTMGLQEESKPLSQWHTANTKDLSELASTGTDDLQFRGRRRTDKQASTDVGTFELVDLKQNDPPLLAWGRARLPPLETEEWATFLDSEGRVVDSKAFRKRIFYGGVEHRLRHEVWKFLLGYHRYDSTFAEREDLTARKHEEYKVLKAQWQTVSEDQAKRFAKFRERRSRIEKDVVRTDRVLPFYAGDDNRNVTMLHDILVTYSFYNFDLGYCQGMSDLLSPILFVMEEEAEAFWCFVALMELFAPNFHRDQNGMHSQLLAVSKLVELLDSPLHKYLKQADCLNYFFCFRWILIQFKREFDYENVMRLWEVFWTHYLSEHFHLYMCVAILKKYRRKIVEEEMDFDTLLKFINELSGRIDLEGALREAESLCVVAGDLGTSCIPVGTPPALPVPTI